MAIKASAETSVFDYTDVDHVTEWFCATESSSAPSAPATTQASATPTGWTQAEPTISSDADLSKTAWRCLQLVWGDGTCGWGEVTKVASYEAAKRAWNKAYAAQSAADGVSVGGRNLLRRTDKALGGCYIRTNTTDVTLDEDGTVSFARATAAGYAKKIADYLDYAEYGPGEYTLSFDARTVDDGDDTGAIVAYAYIGYSTASRAAVLFASGYDRYGREDFPLTGEWARYGATWSVPSDLTTGKAAALVAGSLLTIQLGSPANSRPMQFRRVKLERGNRATDWSPAPEDPGPLAAESRNLLAGTTRIATDDRLWAYWHDHSEGRWEKSGSSAASSTLARTQDGVRQDHLASGSTGIVIPLVCDACVRAGETVTLSLTYRGTLTTTGTIYILVASSSGISQNVSFPLVGDGEWHDLAATWAVRDNGGVARSLLVFLANSDSAWVEVKDGTAVLERGSVATRLAAAEADVVAAQGDATQALADAASAQSSADAARASAVRYATCDTAASAVAKVATISPADSTFTLEAGRVVLVRFANTNSGAAASLTLDVNGTGAKPIKYVNNGTLGNLQDKGHLKAGGTYSFFYDGTNWVVELNYNSNTNYYDRRLHNDNVTAYLAVTAKHLIGGGANGYRELAAGAAINLGYPILYASAAIAQYATSKAAYEALNGVDFSLSLASGEAIQSGAAGKMLWLKGALSGAVFTCASQDWLTTVVPTSEDGSCYVPLGVMTSATSGYFSSSDRVWAYLGGAFQPLDLAAKGLAVEAARTATNVVRLENGTGVIVGDWTGQALGKNVLVDSGGVSVRDGSARLARFEEDYIGLGEQSDDAHIMLSGGRGHIIGGEYAVDIGGGHTGTFTGVAIIPDVSGLEDAVAIADASLGGDPPEEYSYEELLGFAEGREYLFEEAYARGVLISRYSRSDGLGWDGDTIIRIGGTQFWYDESTGRSEVDADRLIAENGVTSKGGVGAITSVSAGTFVSAGSYVQAGTYVGAQRVELTGTAESAADSVNDVPVIIGSRTGRHIEMDRYRIQGKSDASTPAGLYLNQRGGSVYLKGNDRAMRGWKALYVNASGINASTTNALSETLANFNFALIVYSRASSAGGSANAPYQSVEVAVPNGKYVDLSVSYLPSGAETTIQRAFATVYLSGKNITFSKVGYTNQDIYNNVGAGSSGSSYIYIHYVYGAVF